MLSDVADLSSSPIIFGADVTVPLPDGTATPQIGEMAFAKAGALINGPKVLRALYLVITILHAINFYFYFV